MDQRCDRCNVESVAASSDTLAWDHSKNHKGTLALPFCHRHLRAAKPKDARYPRQIATLGDELRAKRMDLGLQQKEVAAMIGVTEDTVCYWENDRVKPSKMHRERINRFIGRDV